MVLSCKTQSWYLTCDGQTEHLTSGFKRLIPVWSVDFISPILLQMIHKKKDHILPIPNVTVCTFNRILYVNLVCLVETMQFSRHVLFSFCRGCINSYLKSSRTPSVPCPMCQRPVNKRFVIMSLTVH